ncbi:MAG: alpha/beta hydrolase [Neomegalonema sp.]
MGSLSRVLLRLTAWLILVSVGAVVLMVFVLGGQAIEPIRAEIGEPPTRLGGEIVRLSDPDVPELVGWAGEAPIPCGALVLVHGRGHDRRQMLSYAEMFKDEGFSVSLFDLRANGESGGEIRGFGFHEGRGVTRMILDARDRWPGLRLGAVGVSLGAASLTMGDPEAQADSYVLELLSSDLVATTATRVWLPFAKRFQAQLMLLQTPVRMGHWADELRPVDRSGELRGPLLLLAAGADPWATPAQAEDLYAAASEPKELVWFDGAEHDILLKQDRRKYIETVVPFLKDTLCDGG